VIFDSSLLTNNRTVTFPDMNVKVVGEASSQTLTNKIYKGAIFADVGDDTRKIQFDLSNIEDNQTYVFSFPDDDPSAPLNNGTASNVLVAERKTQTLYNKTLELAKINNPNNVNGTLIIDAGNLTGSRTIQFPDADATLLSTNNISEVAITFGGALSAPVLGGQLRLQSFFQAGW